MEGVTLDGVTGEEQPNFRVSYENLKVIMRLLESNLGQNSKTSAGPIEGERKAIT